MGNDSGFGLILESRINRSIVRVDVAELEQCRAAARLRVEEETIEEAIVLLATASIAPLCRYRYAFVASCFLEGARRESDFLGALIAMKGKIRRSDGRTRAGERCAKETLVSRLRPSVARKTSEKTARARCFVKSVEMHQQLPLETLSRLVNTRIPRSTGLWRARSEFKPPRSRLRTATAFTLACESR